METRSFKGLLPGRNSGTMRQSNINVDSVDDQGKFDNLFHLVFHNERTLVIRAANAIEKITAIRPEFLTPHKNQLLEALNTAHHKELKWHIARIIARVDLTETELNDVWHKLSYWVLNKSESKSARVNALKGLFDLSIANPVLKDDFEKIVFALGDEMIPSIQAKIRKLKNTKIKL
ncbi:MAG TPA: hypothetical protein VFZ52_04210 [Chryseolinea sp.]